MFKLSDNDLSVFFFLFYIDVDLNIFFFNFNYIYISSEIYYIYEVLIKKILSITIVYNKPKLYDVINFHEFIVVIHCKNKFYYETTLIFKLLEEKLTISSLLRRIKIISDKCIKEL